MKIPVINNYTIYSDLLNGINKFGPDPVLDVSFVFLNKVTALKAMDAVADHKSDADRGIIEEDQPIGGKIDVYT